MVEPDIDLYADDLDDDFNNDGEYGHESNVDLYDDVISRSGDRKDERRSSSGAGSPHHSSGNSRRIPCCIGNLTWWTTDKDLIDAIHNLGITDVLDIKFHENRANGQSKGFCITYFATEASIRVVTEKLPRKELHGQNPVVTPYNKQNLNYFELQSRKGSRYEGNNNNNDRASREREWDRRDFKVENVRNMNQDRPKGQSGPPPPYQHMQRGPPVQQMQHPMPHQGPPPPVHQYQPGHPWIPPPQIQHVPPPTNRPGPIPTANTSIPPPPPGLQGPPPPLHAAPPPPANLRLPPPRGPPPPIAPRTMSVPPDTRGPPPPHHEWERSQPPQHVGLHPVAIPNRALPPVPVPGQAAPPTQVPLPGLAPNPHVNPAFLQHPMPTPIPASSQPAEAYSRARYPEYPSNSERSESIGEAEFEEIMNRNRTVSSSAISRAVADASAADFATAIETLVTAISLIKQSKVSNDERCKILISSLQDTLHGIESKSYGSRNRDRGRSRERDRSRERSSRREKSSRRDRSRSRERDYRDRSRERDRYHEDRYRDKDRDHDRDRRSRH